MDRTTSEHGCSGPVDVPATQQEVKQVVITTRTLWSGVGVIFATTAGLWAVDHGPGPDTHRLDVWRALRSLLVHLLAFRPLRRRDRRASGWLSAAEARGGWPT